MSTFDEIQQAILALPTSQRKKLSIWAMDLLNHDLQVAETAAKYGPDWESRRYTVEEYLQLEESSAIRHEYVAGEIFAMSGASRAHNDVAGAVFAAFYAHLRGGPCRAFINDFKVRLKVGRDDVFYYPDVLVACGAYAAKDDHLTDPKLIVEVLSPSTQRIDRREKALNYRAAPSLEEYVLVAQDSPLVIIHRRDTQWTPLSFRLPDDVVRFESIDLTLTLQRIYEKAL
ncbi:MAG TPA: Uma2 family endonuclease [Steroidobacteraceae bacterium]|jgi:Uma2 family endonuclease